MSKTDAKKLFNKYMTTRPGSAMVVIERESYDKIIDLIFKDCHKKDDFRRVFQDG